MAKHALILGSSGDIGAACATTLAAEGWSLYLHYFRNEDKIKKIQLQLKATYPKQDFYLIQADLSEEDASDNIMNAVFNVDGIVVANGQTVYELLTETTPEQMDYLWRTMLKLPIEICQQLQDKLSRQQAGRIVFIGSVYGIQGSSMEVMYSTIKGGQHAFVKAYAQEVASLGITVNAVAPGAVATQMNTDWTEEEITELLTEIPLNRMATPQEIGEAVTFLMSNSAGYITGTVLPVTGGWKV
ncbi:elongation factor P 5-aminopentanone reductase [Vagococcus xieshaowenii]|uniref:SDR family oxidoreductase n=1 Tax=Vagococcus xieshaowenii TaxID=2562451 RepID=A0AAJ5EE81_9ENTE|nr:SDR family oxidoreductase [Vagococcus xieshaowenii]QCA28075.1 SDR family oxidoreductase [Vagococcus xieshaowenii]TFZ40118.1 SDR family oxidoreductase [Vagococcus xieshaowenii]